MTTRHLLLAIVVVAGTVLVGGPGAAQDDQPFAVAPGTGLETEADKEGGVAWADFDGDGCLDAVVNTHDPTLGSRLFRQLVHDKDCRLVFRDVTEAAAPSLADAVRERSVVWGDVDNDGALDLVRNSADAIEVYTSSGPPEFTLTLTQVIDDGELATGGMNTEGIALIDYNADGRLDMVVDSHQFGVLAFVNTGDVEPFLHMPNSGLPVTDDSDAEGDYLTVGDYDGDGDVDVVGRRRADAAAPELGMDLFVNRAGVFAAAADLLDATDMRSGGKGGVVLCDLDNDLDLDLFWTDGDATQPGVNEVWLQTGSASGVFEPSGQPASVAGEIDGASCGDVDNDGDVDLVLTSSESDQLLVNQLHPTGAIGFASRDLPGTGADGEGSSLADADGDGDLDLVINQDGGNVLLVNETDSTNFLRVVATTGTRAAIGATAWIEDCAGTALSGLTQIGGGSGHGSQDGGLSAHFGLGHLDATPAPYVVVVRYVGGGLVRRAVVPSPDPSSRLLSIDEADASDVAACRLIELDATIDRIGDVVAGARGAVTVAVANGGRTDARDVTVTMGLDGAVVADRPSGCSGVTAVVCVLGSVPAGAARGLTIGYDVDADAIAVAVDYVVRSAGEVASSGAVSFPVTVSAELDLTVTVAPVVVPAGSRTIEAAVTNKGPSTATAVVVTNEPGTQLEPMSAALAGGNCIAPLTATSCAIPEIGPGVTLTVVFVEGVAVDATGTVVSEILVSAASIDPDPAGNSSLARSILQLPPPQPTQPSDPSTSTTATTEPATTTSIAAAGSTGARDDGGPIPAGDPETPIDDAPLMVMVFGLAAVLTIGSWRTTAAGSGRTFDSSGERGEGSS